MRALPGNGLGNGLTTSALALIRPAFQRQSVNIHPLVSDA